MHPADVRTAPPLGRLQAANVIRYDQLLGTGRTNIVKALFDPQGIQDPVLPSCPALGLRGTANIRWISRVVSRHAVTAPDGGMAKRAERKITRCHRRSRDWPKHGLARGADRGAMKTWERLHQGYRVCLALLSCGAS